MIQVYKKDNTDFKYNGDIALTPTECTLDAVLCGAWEMNIRHPLDSDGRWKYIEEETVIKAKTFQKEMQLFRISEVEKTDTEITATAYPIFFDSAKDCFLMDVRPTEKNGQNALNIMLTGTKYSGESDIKKISTAYYVRKNILEAISGEDENSFLNRWGGEILYDNYKIIINDRIGGDYGTEIRYGKNMNGINYHIDMSEVVTRIIPVSYNGYTLDGDKPWVDSENINKYAIAYIKEVKFEDVKLTQDAQEDEKSCDTLEELRKELIKRCREMFAEGADLPTVTIDVDMIDIGQTEEYKEYKILETVGLGDTVKCRHIGLDITTKARVIELEWDCIFNHPGLVKLGQFEYDYLGHVTSTVNRVDNAIRPDGTVVGEQIQGVMDAAKALLKLQNTIAKKQDVRAILFEDLDPDSELFGAMCMGTKGFQIANKRTADNKDWAWSTFGTANGFFADLIVAGTMLADRIKGGTLELGGFNNKSGVMKMLGANGEEIGRWDNKGVYSTGHYVSESTENGRKLDMNYGAIDFYNFSGKKAGTIQGWGDGENTIFEIQPENGKAQLLMQSNGNASIGGAGTLGLSGDNVHITGKNIYVNGRQTKTGTAEFSDGSYFEIQNGHIVGGKTAKGTAF